MGPAWGRGFRARRGDERRHGSSTAIRSRTRGVTPEQNVVGRLAMRYGTYGDRHRHADSQVVDEGDGLIAAWEVLVALA